MNYTELYEEVQKLVKRPDLQSTVDSAIKAATLKAHQSDFFFNDLVESAVQFDEARYIQTFNPKEIFPRYRQAKYVRVWEGDRCGDATYFLEHIGIEAALDMYGYTRTEVFYFSGTNLQIRTKIPLLRCLFGAYVHPTITPTENYSSWIAEEYPFAIIYEAARSVFLGIGFTEQSRGMQALVAEQYAALSLSNVDTLPT